MKNPIQKRQVITRLFFRLLPIQILLCLVGAVNGTVSSLFASNYIGQDAMTAVGLYGPIAMLISSVSGMFVGGAQVLCGKYMGKNQVEQTNRIFSLALAVSSAFALFAILVLCLGAMTGLTSVFTSNSVIRQNLDQYIYGMTAGILFTVLGQQLAAFLSLENRNRITITASVVLAVSNLLFNYLFVAVFSWGILGLALAPSAAALLFFVIQAQYFLSGKSMLKFSSPNLDLKQVLEIIRIGGPGALSNIYQTVRGIILNALMISYVGTVGVSAFTAANSVMGLFWTIPGGFVAVSRMLMSVSVGEEDRQTLTDVMRTVLYRCVPLMCVISAGIIACAVPFTKMYFHESSAPVFQMTANGLRILPLCMPLSVICMNFVCYGQISGKQFLVHLLSLLDGVVCVAGFSALLLPVMGMNAVYTANVLNGVVTTIVIFVYAWVVNKGIPKNMDQLMAVPEDFGVSADSRMDLSLDNDEDVVKISRQVQQFCLSKGIDERRAYLSGLFLEEMAGNIVDHGFTKDKKRHAIDLRVVYKDDHVILRLKDDCVKFDPADRQNIVDPDDITKNIGIRMVYSIAEDIRYQNIFGLNVLTIRI